MYGVQQPKMLIILQCCCEYVIKARWQRTSTYSYRIVWCERKKEWIKTHHTSEMKLSLPMECLNFDRHFFSLSLPHFTLSPNPNANANRNVSLGLSIELSHLLIFQQFANSSTDISYSFVVVVESSTLMRYVCLANNIFDKLTSTEK